MLKYQIINHFTIIRMAFPHAFELVLWSLSVIFHYFSYFLFILSETFIKEKLNIRSFFFIPHYFWRSLRN